MLRVGVTGGIGSGKSTVCRLLAQHGARVFNADSEARSLMTSDPDLRAEISAAFGPDVYAADGSLDRERLAARLFGDSTAVERIGGIVHPRVRRRFAEWATEQEGGGIRVAVIESALLLRPGGREGLDLLVAVVAPEETRVRRAAERDGRPEQDIRSRIVHQDSDSAFRQAAEIVIENTGDMAALETAVRRLWDDLSNRE
jgi:dephospho-CoA kinase